MKKNFIIEKNYLYLKYKQIYLSDIYVLLTMWLLLMETKILLVNTICLNGLTMNKEQYVLEN